MPAFHWTAVRMCSIALFCLLGSCSEDEPNQSSPCGDGVVSSPEVCDGAVLGGKTCVDFGFYGGNLACTADCSGFDTTSCTGKCGDNQISGQEVCDSKNLNGKSCATEGFDGGELRCTVKCELDKTGCFSFSGQHTAEYTYDDIGRLVKVSYNSGESITYTYDKGSNLSVWEVR